MSDKQRAAHFWDWFGRRQHIFLHQFETEGRMSQYNVWEVLSHVEGFSNHLGFEITWDRKAHTAQLIITSFGRRRYFKEVRMLLSEAPEIEGWEFIALTPPRDIDFLFEHDFGHTGIKPEALKFELYENLGYGAGKMLTAIYAPEWKPEEEPLFYKAVTWIIQNLVGEETLATCIGTIVLQPMPDDYQTDERVEFITRLPAAVGRLPSRLKVRRNGGLSPR